MEREASRTRSEPVRIGRGVWVGIAAALLLYVGVRALILYTNFDAVCMPNYELGTIGNLSKVILEGHGGATAAEHFDNVGGHVAVGWMAVPFYALFGSSYLALKLVPFTLGVLTLLMVVRLLCVHYRPLAGVVFGFLFALAPPTLTKYSLIAKGNHFENLFFQFLAISCFFEIHTRPKKAPWLAFTGVAGGLAVSFYFGALLTLSLLALTHMIVRGLRQSARDLIWVGPSFLLGLSPLLWLDLDSGGRGRNFLWTRLWENAEAAVSGVATRFANFVTVILPAAGCYESFAGVSARWGGWLFLACFAVAWVFGMHELWRSRSRAANGGAARTSSAVPSSIATPESTRSTEVPRFERWKSLPFLLHLPAMMVFVSAFDFQFKPFDPPVGVGQYRYLVPHFAFACILIAIATSHALAAKRWPARAAGFGLGSASLLTGLFTLPIVDFSLAESGRGAKYEGYWFPYYAHVLLRDMPWDAQHVERELAEFDPMYRAQSYFGVAFLMAWKQDLDRQARADPDALDLDLLLKPFPSEVSIDLARGAGSYLRLLSEQGARGQERFHRVLEALARSPDPRAGYVAEGLALDYQFPLARRTDECLARGAQMRTGCPPALRASQERGLGMACGRLIPRGILSDLSAVHKVEVSTPALQRADFAFGMGWGAAETGGEQPPSIAFWHLIPAGQEPAAMQGFGASLRHNLGRAAAQQLFSHLRSGFSGENTIWVERGLAWENYPAPYPSAR